MSDPLHDEALHAPIRPYASRRVAIGVGILVIIGFGVLVAVLPGVGPMGYKWYDRVLTMLVGLFIAWGLWRYSRIEAVPSERGLRVRNIINVTDVEWAQIVSVRFGGGAPWGVLDLADGDTLTVMALQRADGARGELEAKRLATLVALHSQTERDD